MAIFEEVRLAWSGTELVIPADRVLRAIAAVEDVLTLGELGRCMVAGTLPLARISMAYGALLRHAGAKVSDEEVYDGLFAKSELQQQALKAVFVLQNLMIPPAHLRKPAAEKPPAGAAANSAT
jgi:hypothetical protein